MANQFVKFPFGEAEKTSKDYAAAVAADINNTLTQLTIAQMTGAATLNLTVNAEMPVGARLIVRASADGTNRTLTPGTGMTGTAQTLTANKSYALSYFFDGSSFVHTGTQILN